MLDVREIYGVSPWQRERFDLLSEEAVRLAHGAQAASTFTATPVQVTETSADGHSATLLPVTKLRKQDPVTGEVTYEDHCSYIDTPIHFAGGGGVTATHPVAKGDEGIILHAARDFDAWRQSGGTQQPMDNGINNAGNAIHIPGVRSDPRKLQQVSTEAHHVRSDDKHHVSEMHPDKGISHKSVDPSTPPASENFDPHTQATKFIEHIAQALAGAMARAVDGGIEHSHGVDHGIGAWMKAMAPSGLIQALAHPALGGLISAADGKHSVTATMGGVMLQSATAISFDVPPGGLELPSGGVSSASLAAGAAAQNVGALVGDLGGNLPNPTVVSVLNVANANLLPNAANDSAAAALIPPVAIGHLYRNGSTLMVRVA
jgi:hypothetical protein